MCINYTGGKQWQWYCNSSVVEPYPEGQWLILQECFRLGSQLLLRIFGEPLLRQADQWHHKTFNGFEMCVFLRECPLHNIQGSDLPICWWSALRQLIGCKGRFSTSGLFKWLMGNISLNKCREKAATTINENCTYKIVMSLLCLTSRLHHRILS